MITEDDLRRLKQLIFLNAGLLTEPNDTNKKERKRSTNTRRLCFGLQNLGEPLLDSLEDKNTAVIKKAEALRWSSFSRKASVRKESGRK